MLTLVLSRFSVFPSDISSLPSSALVASRQSTPLNIASNMNGANGIHSNGVNGFHHDEDEEPMTNGHCNGMNILNTFLKLQSLLFFRILRPVVVSKFWDTILKLQTDL